MTARFSASRPSRTRRLLVGASAAAVACGLAHPASAQLARLRAAAGTAPTVTAPIVSIPLRPANMQEALQRSAALQSRADQIRGYVTSARDAAIAATRTKPSDGLSANGLDPIAAVREAAALQAQGGTDNIARAAQLLAGVSAARDATGTNTWEGASAPVQTASGGQTTVTITQTQERALLSWNRFDVGANTTLQFDQKQAGVAQPGWTVVNRVVESIAPSTILGSVKADGTVLVLNRNGVIFGESAQVNLHSLIVSSLEIGNYGRNFRDLPVSQTQVANFFDATTIKDRNTEYLQNGLFVAAPSSGTLPGLLLSSLYAPGLRRTDSEPEIEGDVTIDAGAKITADTGGYLIFAGPAVSNAGILSATEGQVSLQGGRLIAATRSTGAATSADPDVRGLILRTIGTVTAGTERRSSAATALDPTADDGSVINRGLIQSTRGYLSLGAGLFGSVTNAGLLAATTSVSRNGKISLTAGTVTLSGSADVARAGGIEILPDASPETIPQGTANEPPAFKTSVVEIGARADDNALRTGSLGIFIPAVVTLGQNSLILAPSANVTIGRAASTAFDPTAPVNTLSSITLATGAAIDVSGIKDVQLAASRNSIEITPVKRNELRDTPNYREVSLTGDFTLNGSTLFVDPRRSGVRDDGVAWIGSPLIEAGSIASQIGVIASELMTKGGSVSLGVNLLSNAASIASAPRISIAQGATIDFSGGWVHYNEGIVRTSNLLTADGRIVNIGDADPNDIFVGVADGYTALQPRFGQSDSFNSSLLQGNRTEAAYDEGRDAGSLVIGGSAITVEGTLFGNAFAGARQIAQSVRPGLASTIALDPRKLQRAATDLPSGGFVRIGSLTGASGVAAGGDITVTHGAVAPSDGSVTQLDDTMLNAAGLSGLVLQTSGAVSFTAGSDLRLADGGTLAVDAGRSIAFDGNVTIASGTIAARTYELSRAPIGIGSLTAIGSPFRDDDDIATLYAPGSSLPHPFDITVSGTLSTAGRWVNDYQTSGFAQGNAWIDGGAISLTVAPKVLVALGDTLATAEDAGDLSGSIVIDPTALLNVSAGGYVAPDRSLTLNARGGNIALVNETTYASTVLTVPPLNETAGRSDAPIAGSNQSVDFTPSDDVVPALVPSNPVARVSFSESSLKGFGFSRGGTFTLVAPDISFGSDNRAGSSHLSLDFFRTTGFGTLSATTLHSRIVPDIFTNARAGNSAFFDTTIFAVRAGETLDLTQSLLPSFLSAAQAGSLLSLATGSDVTQTLTPGIPDSPFDRVAANLTLGGLTELDVAAGGRIIGAAGGVITTPKLLNEGVIAIHGGSIVQRDYLPFNLAARGLGISDPAFGGQGLADVFGPADANGQFDENAANAAGIVDPLDPNRLITSRELLSRFDAERFVYFLGALGQSEGIRFGAGSVTDLSGTVLVNTHAPYLPSGTQLLTGRVVAGGSVSTAFAFNSATNDPTRTLFSTPRYGNVRYLNAADNALPPIVALTSARTIGAETGATLDISGARGMFDQLATPTSYVRSAVWSNGGSLTIGGGGGSIANLAIDAHGGDPHAFGGTLAWFRPTITRTTPDDSLSGSVAADQIMGAGFDTVSAFGGVTFDGDVSLTLGRAFSVQSAPSTNGTAIANEAQVTISATAGASASVIAPYVRFASRLGTIPQIGGSDPGDATVTFQASAGVDFVGGILFDSSIATLAIDTPGDVRFIGVDDRVANSIALPSLNGRVIAFGDIDIDAGRVYATTGTGNLQRFIEDRRAGVATTVSPFLLAALGDSSIHFGGSHINATTPLSAGSYLKIQASSIAQDGYLAAPLGLLELGSNDQIALGPIGPFIQPTTSLTFGAGSITSVTGAGVNLPYGTTTDLTEYFFSPSTGLPITALPVGQLTLGGDTIDVQSGATLDGRGGGDVFAFEFVSGTGGSRDVLDRINRDQFSSNDYDPVTGIGFQFADHRQVYAIVPADQARAIAPFDPIYSADYTAASGGDLYGAQVGQSVTLDGAPGIPAGEYILLPAHYALLPGAFRVVENTSSGALAPGAAQTLLDGSLIVGGTYSTAGTEFYDSTRRSFTVQSRDTFLKFSRIATTGGSDTIVAQAAARGEIAPRIPLDAARVVLSPKTALTVAGVFDTTAATGGRGAQFDITADNILIAPAGTAPVRRTLVVSDTTLQNLNANSLLIGAERSDNADGTTNLGVIAGSITVGSGVTLSAPELIFAVGGSGSVLEIQDGATLIATGRLDDTLTGDYVVPSLIDAPFGYRFDATGVGAVVRLSSGAERLIDRQGEAALANSDRPASLRIGTATLRGNALALDSSRDFAIGDLAELDASLIGFSGDTLQFGERGIGMPLLGKLATASRLTLRSSGVIRFDAGDYRFNDLTIDGPGLALTQGASGTLTLETEQLSIRNSAADLGDCTGAGALACGGAGTNLILDTTGATFGSGVFHTYGFGGSVALSAANGAYIDGSGALDTGRAALTLKTPFIADRATATDPRNQQVRPDYTFATTGSVTLSAPTLTAGVAMPVPVGNGTPGARIAFGTANDTVASLSITDTLIRATAGVIDIEARGDVTLAGTATLATPGYTRTFGDAVDSVTATAGGGTINLVSLNGGLSLGSGTTLTVDSGIGKAGILNLIASDGAITLGSRINPGVTGARDASLTFDSGLSAFDFAGFVTTHGPGFGGDIAIRSGVGDLQLNAGQILRARSIALTSDGGAISIAGTLDTSGELLSALPAAARADARVNGGDVRLFGMDGVTLRSTALIDTHTSGYLDSDTRSASAGDVTIGIGDAGAAITLASGARIDAGARRTEAAIAAGGTGNRLVSQTVKDPFSLVDTQVYRFALADEGGVVGFRAPVIGAGGDTVDIRLGGTISGASSVEIEGFRRYDLDAIAAGGAFSGVHSDGHGGVSLNFAEGFGDTGLRNILTENFDRGGTKSIVNFIQTFNIKAADGSSFAGIRLRPGVELDSTGRIALATNWNLGAGTLDQQAALDAGLLQVIPQLGLHDDGTPYYAVTPGREAELFQNYVTLLYRVGGRVDGEAGVVTLRAGGTLAVSHSISDGFFSFRDRTDPDYMSYQLGGGDRTVHPAGLFGCGSTFSGDCSQVASFDDILSGDADLNPDTIATISLVAPVAGSDLAPGILAPYSAAANSAAALGSGRNGAGDPLGGADLFPLLNGGTTPVRSTTLRLVGGADARASADPLHVDRATGANVAVTGEQKYIVAARAGRIGFDGGFELRLRPNPGTSETQPLSAAPGSFIAAVGNSSNAEGLDPGAAGDYYTVLDWGSNTEIADTTRQRAIDFFAQAFPDAQFQEPRGGGASTGVAAPLSAILAFLAAYGDEYANKVESGAFATRPPAPGQVIDFGGGDTAYVGTTVRTGDGSIAIAAANSVDLRRTPNIVYRTPLNGEGSVPGDLGVDPTRYQVGGSAVYTAGHALGQSAILASAADGTTIRFAANPAAAAPAFDEYAYQPSIKGQFFNTPTLLVDGGDVSIAAAAGDVLARRDVWAEQNLGTGSVYNARTIGRFSFRVPLETFVPAGFVGAVDQRWRIGAVGENTQISVVPQLFTSGVGALGGGNVAITAGGSIRDLTLALDSSVTTTNPLVPAGLAGGNPLTGTDDATGIAGRPVLLTFDGGNAAISAGGDLIGSQFDFSSGSVKLSVGGDVYSAGGTAVPLRTGELQGQVNELRIRIADATVTAGIGGSIALGGVGALGVRTSDNALIQDSGQGFFSAAAGIDLTANGLVTLGASRPELRVTNFSSLFENSIGFVLPPSLELTSLTSDVTFSGDLPRLLFPSVTGQLSILTGGEIRSLAIAMSDSDPSLLPGAFSARFAAGSTGGGLDFGFNGAFPGTSDVTLRLFHNERTTHADDDLPVRIYAGGSITGSTISLAKQARIGAGLDIVDLFFVGQNARPGDVTRITAGRDIIGSTAFSNSQRRPYINGNNFLLGGFGTLSIEAGRNLGPFLNSATVGGGTGAQSYAGGIRTVGNDLNPWLPSVGANIEALFGIANGADYDALQSVYLDPANAAMLDGDLFVQVGDEAGNLTPDRTRPVYAPVLARFLRERAPAAFASVFGDAPPAEADLAAQSYAKFDALYAAFAGLDNLTRRSFLINQLYFNELAQTGIPTGPSFSQFVRGYRATQTLFSPSLGYTDNLAPYTTDPATITPDHPLGVPTRAIVDGQPAAADRVITGNVDLRLAAIETARGGDITILGPGGDVIAGSVVRTSDQAARRATLYGVAQQAALENGILSRINQVPIGAIPIGFEGVLTLRGGSIRSFTDGDFRLNQSRLFTLSGGDITLWSSNGDLNAGQGPRSASSFPPVTVRFDLSGLTEVDSAGSVAGAGIGAFQTAPDQPSANIILVAPVGEVDAGDAGVRASGNVFVAAARVANADNFSAGGDISGVPSSSLAAAPALPTDAASSLVGDAARLATASSNNADRQSLISVDVLGFVGGKDDCDDAGASRKNCPPPGK